MKKIISVLMILLMLFTNNAFAYQVSLDRTNWFAWELPDAQKVEGTAIDVSFLLDAPAGKHGFAHAEGDKIFFEDNTEARFWGINVAAPAIFGSREDIDKLVSRIAASGYNIVRFHHLDAAWCEENIFGINTDSTQTLAPAQLDKLFYFLAELKERGIYYYIDLLVSRSPNKSLDNIPAQEDLENGWKNESLFDPYLIQLQKDYAYQLLTTVNPYTSVALKDDPAMVFIDVLNENSIQGFNETTLTTDYYMNQLKDKFNQWVRTKYTDSSSLLSAWGALENDESYDNLKLRSDYKTYSEYNETRKTDIYTFLFDTVCNFYDNFKNYLKEIGVKCLITGTSIGGTSNQMPATMYANRLKMDFIDRHTYISHPYSYSFSNGMGFGNYLSPLVSEQGGGFLIGYNAWQRIYNTPYVMGEWLECIPNRFRAEANLMLSSYACFQNWNSIAYNLVENKLSNEKNMLSSSFETYYDPVLTSTAIPASLVFHRHEVAEAQESYYLSRDFNKTMEYGYTELTGWLDIVPYAKVGTMFSTIEYDAEQNSKDTYNKLKTKANNMETQSNEINWNYKEEVFKLTTDYTNGAVGALNKKKTELEYVDFDIENEFSTVTLSSVTSDVLGKSERMLLNAVGRAENTNMAFSDAGDVMTNLGTSPILVEPICGNIELKLPFDVRVYSLDSSGNRTKEIDVINSDGKQSFRIGNDKTLYYEIVKFEPMMQCTYQNNSIKVDGIIPSLSLQSQNATVTLYRKGYNPDNTTINNIKKAIYAVKPVQTDLMGNYNTSFMIDRTDCEEYSVVLNTNGNIYTETIPIDDYIGLRKGESQFTMDVCELAWSPYTSAFSDNIKYYTRDGSSVESNNNGPLRIKCIKENGGISIDNSAPIGINTNEIDKYYLEFDIKCEDMTDERIRVIFCYGDFWSPTEFGLWEYALPNADKKQTVKIPLNSISSSDWDKVSGIRIDPCGDFGAGSVTVEKPVYIELDNIKIVKEYPNEISVKAGLYDENGAVALNLTPDSIIDFKLNLKSISYTNISKYLCAIVATYNNGVLKGVEIMHVANETESEIIHRVNHNDCNEVKVFFFKDLESIAPIAKPLNIY